VVDRKGRDLGSLHQNSVTSWRNPHWHCTLYFNWVWRDLTRYLALLRIETTNIFCWMRAVELENQLGQGTSWWNRTQCFVCVEKFVVIDHISLSFFSLSFTLLAPFLRYFLLLSFNWRVLSFDQKDRKRQGITRKSRSKKLLYST